jgi:hypothetical protein
MTSRLRTLLGCAALLLASAFGTAGVASAQQINIAGCASLSAPVVSGSNITITCNPNVVAPGSPSCSGAQPKPWKHADAHGDLHGGALRSR